MHGQSRDDIPVHLLPPKYVVNDKEKFEEYVAYHKEHLPDTSHCPATVPERTHFWKMNLGMKLTVSNNSKSGKKKKLRKGGKARARPHSILTGW